MPVWIIATLTKNWIMEEKHFGMDDEFGFRYVMFGVFVDYIIAKSSMQLAIPV